MLLAIKSPIGAVVFEVIETTEKLEAFMGKISAAKWVALDTEFLREKTYYAKLCLIQIEAEGHRACVDPLSIDDMSSLYEVLHNPDVTIVLHAAHQDMEILLQLSGKAPSPIFDTQVAAAVLGLGDTMAYARMVEQMLGVAIDKSQVRTDWSRRPLKEAQLKYAIDDVRYLAQIYPMMLEKLNAQNRLAWLDKDFATAIDPKTYAINAEQRWKKIRGNQVLKRPQLAILRELAAWRENLAEQKNLPRKWIIGDDILIDLARQNPKDSHEIGQIRGINADRTKKYHETWLELIKKGAETPESEWPELPRSKKPTPTQNGVIDMLMLVIQIEAKKQGITPAVIAGRKQVANMIQSGETKLSDDWRGEIVNETFARVLSGKMVLGIESSKLVLKEA
jgi:ribonuclease D